MTASNVTDGLGWFGIDNVLAQASCRHVIFVDYTGGERGLRSQLGTKWNSAVHFYQSEENGMHKPWYSYDSV